MVFTIPGISPFFLWSGFIFLILIFLALDLGVFNRKIHVVSIKEALVWSLVWFTASMLFNVFIWYEAGSTTALEFFTGYLIEKSLSVDNLFVILLIFTSFNVRAHLQHRVLFWGILGALVMRGLLIGVGSVLIQRFEWILYIFGAFLVFTGIKMFFESEKEFDHEKSVIVRFAKKFMPVSQDKETHHFFTKENGKPALTIPLLALFVVEVSDVVFALDSIPAIFSITTDPFIVFTSNVFAILGLRSLYFVIARAHDLFAHLKYGLAIILCYVGAKMLLESYIHIPIFVSLGIVVAILITAIVTSVMFHKAEPKDYEHDK